MSAILFITGTTRGDTLGSLMRAAGHMFSQFGFEALEMNLGEPNVFTRLEEQLNTKDILCAISAAGIGRDIDVPQPDGSKQNLWEMVGVPYISINGDSPAYFFDRHTNASAHFATLYSFREHYLLRKRLPHQMGLIGVAPPAIISPIPEADIDFTAKENGKLIFLKNSNDPKALKALWRANCRPYILNLLMELADILEANMETDAHTDLDALVCEAFKTKGLDVDALLNLRLFFTAQLDDYLRRAKCTFMAEVLSDFPVEIRGDNWEYMDFAGKKCSYIPGCDYAQSSGLINGALGILDMSPNTQGGFHDRALRSYSAHTLCISNEQECVTQTFPNAAEMSFSFSRDSLAARIADVLARPKDYVEIGREGARLFNELYPQEALVRSIVEAVDAIRLNSTKQRPPMQDFFMWPPSAR